MAEFDPLPSELTLPKEFPQPAPEIYPPPEEGTAGTAAVETEAQKRRRLRHRKRNAFLLAAAGAALCGVMYTAPKGPTTTTEPPGESSVSEPITKPTQPALVETEPVVLTGAERLVAVGTWKNGAENEWVHFNADGSGWWYDGTYFGRMVWEEGSDGSVRYEAGMAYLGPGLQFQDEHSPEKEGDCLHSAESSGGIDLLADEDCFTCPGLRFGEGSYLPDDTAIDTSVMDGVCGKTAAELVGGTSWHMAEISDLGIPVAPSLEGGKSEVYTDMVYVQSIDFAAGTLTLATRDDGLLWLEDWAVTGDFIYSEAAPALDASFTLADGVNRVKGTVDLSIETTFGFFSDMHPGDVEYNNQHFLWGRQVGPDPTEVYLLITSAGLRLGIDCMDLFADNYTLLAAD